MSLELVLRGSVYLFIVCNATNKNFTIHYQLCLSLEERKWCYRFHFVTLFSHWCLYKSHLVCRSMGSQFMDRGWIFRKIIMNNPSFCLFDFYILQQIYFILKCGKEFRPVTICIKVTDLNIESWTLVWEQMAETTKFA